MKLLLLKVGIILLSLSKTGTLLAEASYSSDSIQERHENFISFSFSNDIFFKTDHYFTNGMLFEMQLDRLALKITNRINYYKKVDMEWRHRYAINQNIYTPENYTADTINLKDRPFAGTLTLSYYEDVFEGNTKNTFGFMLGALGRPSRAEQIQNFIHSVINNNLAIGWDNQINNDVIINLYYSYSRRLLASETSDLTGRAEAYLGTLNTSLSGSLHFRIGKCRYMFSNNGPKKPEGKRGNWQYFFYTGISPQFVLYNATLQGGIFSQSKNEHTFNFDQVEHLVLGIEWGVVVGFKKLNITLHAARLTPEFVGGKTHGYGTIQLRYVF